MATVANTSLGAALLPDYMQRVEKLAQKHGWTVDETIDRALDLTEIVLDAKDHDPDSKVYLYRDGSDTPSRLQTKQLIGVCLRGSQPGAFFSVPLRRDSYVNTA